MKIRLFVLGELILLWSLLKFITVFCSGYRCERCLYSFVRRGKTNGDSPHVHRVTRIRSVQTLKEPLTRACQFNHSLCYSF